MAEREVVVVTGASGGVGRAVAREFAKHGAAVGLIARGRAGLDAAAREVSELGGIPYAYQADVADFDAVEAAAVAIEERLGPIDVWINNAMTTVFSFLDDVEPARVRARHPRHLPGSGVGNEGRAGADASARPRHDRPGRLGARLPRHPAPGAVLRRQARDEGHVRVAAVRAPPPRQQRARDDGPAARDEHAAVRPLPEQDAAPPDAGAADLRARGRRPRGLLGRRTTAGASCTSASRPCTRSSATRLAPWLAERYLAKTAVDGQQTDQRFDGAAAANLFEPVDDDHDEGAHGIFDDQSHRRSEQAWLSRHRLGSGLAAAAVAGGAAAALLTRRRA